MLSRKTVLLSLIAIPLVATSLVGIKRLSAKTVNPGQRTLKEQAQVSGGRFATLDRSHHNIFFTDIEHISRASARIVIGTIQKNNCHLSSDAKSITTDYVVTV